MSTEDYRSVPLDVVREHFAEQAEISSLREVATRAGIGRSTLANFIQGATSPHPRVKRALTLLYLLDQRQSNADGGPWGSPEVRLAARVLANAYRAAREPVPQRIARLATSDEPSP